MKVRMDIKYFDKNKQEIMGYNPSIKKVYFQFVLNHCQKRIEEFDKTYYLEDIESGHILSKSELNEIEKGKVYNHIFTDCSWGYDCATEQVFIYNQTIDL